MSAFKFKTSRQIASEGSVQGVLAEIVHLGEVETQYGIKDKVRFIFEITEYRNGTDTPLNISVDFNNTWSRKSNMFDFVQQMLGRKLTSGETMEFDPDLLIGKNALLTIIHNESNGTVYANIKSVMPLVKGMPEITVSDNYVPWEILKAKWASKDAEDKAVAAGASIVDAAPSNVEPNYTV